MHVASIVSRGCGIAMPVCTVKSFALGLRCCVTHRTSSNQYRRLILRSSAGGGNCIQTASLARASKWRKESEKQVKPRVFGKPTCTDSRMCMRWRGNITRVNSSCLVTHSLTRSTHNPVRENTGSVVGLCRSGEALNFFIFFSPP